MVVPLGAKDLWNSSKPENDAQFANGVADPELGKLLKGLYNISVPTQGPFGSTTQRDDLEAIFLTGIPELTKPANVQPSEELRLNVAVQPAANPNKLGVLGGDSQGYPNGRRLGDDVVDISLRAIAGAAYPLFHSGYVVDATGAQLGDGVDANDAQFRSSFPYLALPHQGFDSVPHGTKDSSPAMKSDNDNGNIMSECHINRNLALGHSGDDVSCLQEYLVSHDYLTASASGHFGRATKKALIRWQQAVGIKGTGFFGMMSRNAFNAR